MTARVGWWGLVVLGLAACEPIRPGPAKYACERTKPLETQCLDGWRCGADGFCFDPTGVGAVPSRCEDPVTDCPTGWKCNLTNQCFDPKAPTAASFACRNPDTDCPDDWKCGLDQRCLDPLQPGPWRCEDTEKHCTGRWTCGATGLCFDRADAGRILCRTSVPTDCNDGWRCGIDGLCQQVDAGAAWPCLVDGDCEANWRCGLAGLCVDSAPEGLRPNDGTPQGLGLSLGWGTAMPDELGLSNELSAGLCEGFSSTLFYAGAARFGTTLQLFAVSAAGGPGLPAECDAGFISGDVPLVTATVDLSDTPPRQIAQRGATTYVNVDGGVRRFTLRAPGNVQEGPPEMGDLHRLRTSTDRNCVLGIGAARADCLSPTGVGARFVDAPLVAIDGGPARIFDVITWPFAAGKVVLFAGTDQGLFSRDLDNAGVPEGPWVHVQWWSEHTEVEELRRARQNGGVDLLVALVRQSGQEARYVVTSSVNRTPRVAATDAGLTSSYAGPGALFSRPLVGNSAVYRLGTAENFVFCPSAPRGWLHAPVAVAADPGVGASTSLLRCSLTDGGLELQRVIVNPFSSLSPISLSAEAPPLSRDAVWVSNDDQTVALADRTGGLYVASSLGNELVLRPWVMASAPEAVSGRPGRWVMTRLGAQEYRLGTVAVDATRTEAHFIGGADAGFALITTQLSNSTRFSLVSGVEGDPELSVFNISSQAPEATYLVGTDPAGPLGSNRPACLPRDDGGCEDVRVPVYARGPATVPGQHASVARGGTDRLWFLTRGDQLLVAPIGAPVPVEDLATAAARPEIPLARLANTPLPGAPLSHVLGLPADADSGAGYGQALVVALGRLFLVRGESAVVWRPTELNNLAAEVVKTWADETRVRIGDREGRVRSFPSRVVIGPPLTGSTSWDFVDVCGVTYALGSDGLFRLRATAGVPVGTWSRVPVPTNLRFATGGRLHTDGARLLVFDELGRVAEVSGLTCAQPL